MSLNLSIIKTDHGALSKDFMTFLQKVSQADAFVETGTYLGATVAAMKGVFESVISIELSDELYFSAKQKFVMDTSVTILHGDSSSQLSSALGLIENKIPVIWLDAHWSGGNTAKSESNTPIINELKVLESLAFSNGIILIDDIRYFVDLPTAGFETHDANSGYPRISDVIGIIQRLPGEFGTLILGDILIAAPLKVINDLEPSKVVLATTGLRLRETDIQRLASFEAIIANATGNEKETIMQLPEFYKHSIQYGIGGDYYYWRGLVYEAAGDLQNAKQDFLIARKCGLDLSKRLWEGE